MTSDKEEWLTTEEVAQRLRVSEDTVRRWLKSGQLSGSLLGGRYWRVSEADLKAYMESRRHKPDNQ